MENDKRENNSLPWFVPVGLVLMFIWGLLGFFSGDGFFGGIIKQIDAIGDLIALIIKVAVLAVVGTMVFKFFLGKNDHNED